MAELLVIADDFTGALDVASPLLSQGWELTFAPDCERLPPEPSTGALIVNTASRHTSPVEAGQRVSSVLRAYPDISIVFKKIDSTLRGNIGTEVAALQSERGASPCFYSPAFPEAGRTTVSGQLLVDGVPVAETRFAQDPLAPVRSSDVLSVLDAPALVITRDIGDSEAMDAFAESIAEHHAGGNRALSLVGSAGLVHRVGRIVVPTRRAIRPDFPKRFVAPIILVGSVAEASLAQVATALEAGFSGVRITVEDVCEGDTEAVCARATALGASSGPLGRIVHTASCESEVEAFARLPGADIARFLVRVGVDIFRELTPQCFVVFGGETSADFFAELGVRELRPEGEIEPGVNVVQFCFEEQICYAICKSGGFGEVDLIRKITL